MEYVLNVAMAANVKQVVLSHHDPGHDDDFLDAMEARCQDQVRASGSDLDVLFAAEGLEIHLPEASEKWPARCPARPRLQRQLHHS